MINTVEVLARRAESTSVFESQAGPAEGVESVTPPQSNSLLLTALLTTEINAIHLKQVSSVSESYIDR